MVISKRKFMENWIAENFEDGAVTVEWQDKKAILTDRNGKHITVEMRDLTLYADGKPYAGIPSLADVSD